MLRGATLTGHVGSFDYAFDGGQEWIQARVTAGRAARVPCVCSERDADSLSHGSRVGTLRTTFKRNQEVEEIRFVD